jgi:hypothetical protein
VFASMALNRQMLVTAARNGRPSFWERPSRELLDPEVARCSISRPSERGGCQPLSASPPLALAALLAASAPCSLMREPG